MGSSEIEARRLTIEGLVSYWQQKNSQAYMLADLSIIQDHVSPRFFKQQVEAQKAASDNARKAPVWSTGMLDTLVQKLTGELHSPLKDSITQPEFAWHLWPFMTGKERKFLARGILNRAVEDFIEAEGHYPSRNEMIGLYENMADNSYGPSHNINTLFRSDPGKFGASSLQELSSVHYHLTDFLGGKSLRKWHARLFIKILREKKFPDHIIGQAFARSKGTDDLESSIREKLPIILKEEYERQNKPLRDIIREN